jgi:hypothetical protein
VKWSALGEEALVALGAVVVVAAAGMIIIGTSRAVAARREGHGGAATLSGVSLVLAGTLICLAAVVLGFIAMTTNSS